MSDMTNNNDTNSSANDSTDLDKLKRQMFYSKLIVCCIILTVLILYFSNFHVSVSIKNEDWGTFGDFIGGILNPIIAAFALYWLITSVNLQIQELKKTNEALVKTVETAEKQQNQVFIQSFENLFFELLKTKSDATNEIIYSSETIHGQTNPTLTGKNAIKKHVVLYKDLERKENWDTYYRNNLLDIFGSYFRICYHIVKLIDNNTILKNLEKPNKKDYSIKQKEYFDLFRATLTQHELEAFFFNCLSSYGNGSFKKLIEKYGMFEPLPMVLKKHDEKSVNICSYAYQYNSTVFEDNKDWKAYFKDIREIDTPINPKEVMKNVNYLKSTNIHLGFKDRDFGLLSFEIIKENINDKIISLEKKFRNNTKPNMLSTELSQQYNELNILKKVPFSYEIYMAIKYEIDFNEFVAHQNKKNIFPNQTTNDSNKY